MNEEDLFVSKGSLKWKEKNKELVINGVYYEVLSVKLDRGIATIIIVEDAAETIAKETAPRHLTFIRR